jgi:L-ribulose-5-phosphate 3-epimerase
MNLSRRTFLSTATAGLAGAAMSDFVLRGEPTSQYRVSARQFGENLEAAKRASMDGVEIGVGGPAERLSIADLTRRQRIKEQVQATGVKVSSLSMDLLNGNPVASDPRAVDWLTQTIEAAQDLGAVGILVPFFGQGNLLNGRELKTAAVDAVVANVKKAAPAAREAKVFLGLETTCSAKQDLEILDRINSEWVSCYYDIGNSTSNGYDVPAEIRALKGRICLIHFKDGSNFLGEGKVQMPPVAQALKDIDYQGWIVLETANPTKNAVADCQRNANFIRQLMGS